MDNIEDFTGVSPTEPPQIQEQCNHYKTKMRKKEVSPGKEFEPREESVDSEDQLQQETVQVTERFTGKSERVDLPPLTKENCHKMILLVGRVYLWWISTNAELQEDVKKRGRNFWMTDSAIYAYIQSIVNLNNSRVLVPSEPTFIFSTKDVDKSQNIFKQYDGEIAYDEAEDVYLPSPLILSANKTKKIITVADPMGIYPTPKKLMCTFSVHLQKTFEAKYCKPKQGSVTMNVL
ncbi:unnamed protein product [Allacma fusca]|uniref:Uncharacterized protein n=1 Tax=Allacma fusca TaxID=39272 RepID=A0A8J2K1L3_9HEXA|nr:unnamed protein product [Allacma fusca]